MYKTIEYLKHRAVKLVNNIRCHEIDPLFDEDDLVDIIAEFVRQPRIVQCKDCKYRNDRTRCPCYRDRWEMDDWFCRDGRKKDV